MPVLILYFELVFRCRFVFFDLDYGVACGDPSFLGMTILCDLDCEIGVRLLRSSQ